MEVDFSELAWERTTLFTFAEEFESVWIRLDISFGCSESNVLDCIWIDWGLLCLGVNRFPLIYSVFGTPLLPAIVVTVWKFIMFIVTHDVHHIHNQLDIENFQLSEALIKFTGLPLRVLLVMALFHILDPVVLTARSNFPLGSKLWALRQETCRLYICKFMVPQKI